MSENKPQESSYVGTPVRLSKNTREELGIEWSEAIIAAVFPTNAGLGIHLVNPEDGTVTPGFGLEHVEFLPETINGLKAIHRLQQMAIAQIVEMFDD